MVIHKIESRENLYKTNYAFWVGNHSTWCVRIILKRTNVLWRAWKFKMPILDIFEDFFAVAVLECRLKMCSGLSEVFLVLYRNAFLEGYVQQFLYTFRYFCTQEEFLQFLLDRISSTLSRYSKFSQTTLSKHKWVSSQ